MTTTASVTDTTHTIGDALRSISPAWDGKEAIKEMKKGGSSHWRQMEWIGFYFEFLCQNRLATLAEIPGPRYGKTGFDALSVIPWDFKAHAMNTSAHQIIVNDTEAIQEAVKKYGAVGLILALGEVKYNDEKRRFQKWHQKLKGGASDYEKERVERGAWSRLRKISFLLRQVSFIVLTENSLRKAGSFQADFRNADGKPRRKKVLIDLEKIGKELVHKIDFI